MSENYLSTVIGCYLEDPVVAKKFNQTKLIENIESFGKLLLSCYFGKDIAYYEDGNEIAVDVKKIQDEVLRKMIKKMCDLHGQVGVTFNDLEDYLHNLRKGKDTDDEIESPMIASKTKWHGPHPNIGGPFKYKTDDTNANDFEEDMGEFGNSDKMKKKASVEVHNNAKDN